MTLIIVLFVLASLLIIAEVLFPSFGLLSLLAVSAYVGAVMRAFDLGQTEGYVALVCVILLAPVTIWGGFQILKHTPIGNRLILKGPAETEVRGQGINKSINAFLGRDGIAATDLRPSGAVDIGHNRVDAVSDGGFIATGSPVRVVYIEGNRLVVQAVEDT